MALAERPGTMPGKQRHCRHHAWAARRRGRGGPGGGAWLGMVARGGDGGGSWHCQDGPRGGAAACGERGATAEGTALDASGCSGTSKELTRSGRRWRRGGGRRSLAWRVAQTPAWRCSRLRTVALAGATPVGTRRRGGARRCPRGRRGRLDRRRCVQRPVRRGCQVARVGGG
jgi:hypothetical protein